MTATVVSPRRLASSARTKALVAGTFTSSLFSTVYRYMPNDTDLTVFRRRNIPGMNFAFIEGPTHYHTPLDNVANPGSAPPAPT